MSEARSAEVLIIGAGPAGTAMAAHLGNLGVRGVTLVDAHDFPRDKTCGSGISPKGIQVLRQLGVWERVEAVSLPIRGIRLVTPGDQESFQSAGENVEAVICYRRVLDHELLKHAVERGVEFVPDFTVRELIKDGDRVVGAVARDGRRIEARTTVLAAGAHCKLAGPPAASRRLIHAIMGWWENVAETRPGYVEMIYDRELVPYYGWLFPETDERVNIGITYEHRGGEKRNARALFQEFLDRQYGPRLDHATQLGGWKGHPIAYSYRIGQLHGPGYVVVGEAGCLTHPATAEGIYQGMRSGMLAAEAIRDVVAAGVPEARAMNRYEGRCRREFQLSFLAARLFRRATKTPALDWLVSLSETPLLRSATARLMAKV